MVFFTNIPSEQKYTMKMFWDKFLKMRHAELDDRHAGRAYGKLQNYIFGGPWYRIFDFIEAIIEYDITGNSSPFSDRCNLIFEEENVGYRLIGGIVTKIISDEEIVSVEKVISSPIEPIKNHFMAALRLLSDRESPDFRNSIKESISAVECMCQIIIGDKNTTLGKALKRLENAEVEINQALKDGFSKLYGWTSSGEGIRHAMMDMSTVDQDDARYMLITCSAFVNYLTAEASKADIDLLSNWGAIR